MTEHSEQQRYTPTTAEGRPVIVSTDHRHGFPHISWGAVFAGGVAVLALAWLFHLLGLALGVSVADAADSYTMQGGLTIAASLWIIISWLVAIFIGAMVTARLAGRIDDFSGMLHGLTLWGVATIATLVLTYCGIASVLQTGQQLASNAVSRVAAGTDDALAVIPEGTASRSSWRAGDSSRG